MESIYSEAAIDDFVIRAIHHLMSLRTHRSAYTRRNQFTRMLPSDIRHYMSDLILEDLDEMASCVSHGLWTAAALMAFRILEETVLTHVSEDLGVPIKKLNLQKAITHLKRSFSAEFTKQIDRVRQTRNRGMHATERYGEAETREILELVIWLTVYVYSIPQES